MSQEIGSPEELVRYVASSLVRDPDAVKIDIISGSEETIVELRVEQEDLSRVIGRGGSIVRSLRTLLRSCSYDEEKQGCYVLEIIE